MNFQIPVLRYEVIATLVYSLLFNNVFVRKLFK